MQPDRPDELLRVQAAGGRVIYWDVPRVLGMLAMSRAIGEKRVRTIAPFAVFFNYFFYFFIFRLAPLAHYSGGGSKILTFFVMGCLFFRG